MASTDGSHLSGSLGPAARSATRPIGGNRRLRSSALSLLASTALLLALLLIALFFGSGCAVFGLCSFAFVGLLLLGRGLA